MIDQTWWFWLKQVVTYNFTVPNQTKRVLSYKLFKAILHRTVISCEFYRFAYQAPEVYFLPFYSWAFVFVACRWSCGRPYLIIQVWLDLAASLCAVNCSCVERDCSLATGSWPGTWWARQRRQQLNRLPVPTGWSVWVPAQNVVFMSAYIPPHHDFGSNYEPQKGYFTL